MIVAKSPGVARIKAIAWNDDTLYSVVDGVVKFERLGRDKKQASVYPVGE